MSETATIRPESDSEVDAVAATLRGLLDEIHIDAAGNDSLHGSASSIANMRSYLALREHDNRALQASLARRGLSSLGRSEGHVRATFDKQTVDLSGPRPANASGAEMIRRGAVAPNQAAVAAGR